MRESIQADVYTSVLITLVPAILSFGLRFYARSIKKVPLWWDDWLAVVGMVCVFPDPELLLVVSLISVSQIDRYRPSATMPLSSGVCCPTVQPLVCIADRVSSITPWNGTALGRPPHHPREGPLLFINRRCHTGDDLFRQHRRHAIVASRSLLAPVPNSKEREDFHYRDDCPYCHLADCASK